ncbi:MAG: aldose 1-epimerase family protein, partial [Bacteroidota bacterium]
MFTIENENLTIIISPKGAELQSIYNRQAQLEYMWSGDVAFWGKKSPVLFPIVGTLKADTFYY